MNKTYNSIIIPSPEVLTRGGYIAPKVRSLVLSQVHGVLCASKDVSPQTDVVDEGFIGGDDYLMF